MPGKESSKIFCRIVSIEECQVTINSSYQNSEEVLVKQKFYLMILKLMTLQQITIFLKREVVSS